MIPNTSIIPNEKLKRRSNWRFELYDEESDYLISDRISLSGNSVSASVSGKGFPIGQAICRSISIKIRDGEGENFIGKRYSLRAVIPTGIPVLGGKMEYYTVHLGYFTITDQKTENQETTLTGYDDMIKADKTYDYFRHINGDNSVGDELAQWDVLFKRACAQSGLSYKPLGYDPVSKMENTTYVTNITCRQLLAELAGAIGGNVFINRDGEIEMKTYHEIEDDKFFKIDNAMSLKNKPERKISSVQTTYIIDKTVSEENRESAVLKIGTDGYVIDMSKNIFFKNADYDQALLNLGVVENALKNVYVTEFECTLPVNPLLEFMDLIKLMRADGTYIRSFVTNVKHNAQGLTEIRNTTENSSTGTSSAV